MSWFYIGHPVVNMRQEPSPSAPVVSQAYFQEEVRLIEEKEGWSCIISSDGYGGWIPKEALLGRETPYLPNGYTYPLATPLYRVPTIEHGPLCLLPYCTPLHLLEAISPLWVRVALADNTFAFARAGVVRPGFPSLSLSSLPSFAKRFLEIPYLWGGRTSFGLDCSGFIQLLYRHAKIFLPRDAKDQIHAQELCPLPLEQMQGGDLLFFGSSEEKIGHVAMAIDDISFIHATSKEELPSVQYNSLEDPLWRETGAYPYRTVRRSKTGSLLGKSLPKRCPATE